MTQYFYEVFENIPRQGPGLNSSTRRAYEVIAPKMPAKPDILDIGCGKGVQTLELARISEGKIIATDTRDFFLTCLRNEAEKLGYSNRITTQHADMTKLPFREAQFDLIWAEGSIFIMGIKDGLNAWYPFIKPGGALVFSDLVWLTDNRPPELETYWEGELPYILTVEEAQRLALEKGYTPLTHFTLPIEGWSEAFYKPQKQVIDKLRKKYKGIKEAMDEFDGLEAERELILNNYQYIGYEFFMLEKPA